ncbi:MAG: hypothetical protein WCD53_16475 [Microcoleus sp.]
MFYVLINSNGIEVRESKEMLTLKEMQNLVGIEGEPAYIEVASYQSFSDRQISMICDEEFLRKECQPTCKTIEGHIVHGQVLILGTNAKKDDFDLLSKQQVEIVKREIKLVRLSNRIRRSI